MMKISVIVPVYNEEKYISQCLKSISDQTRKPDEIIVVDDGSTDNSIRIVRKSRPQASNFKLLKQKHSGPGKARNLGAKKAKADILVFVDGDMKFDKKYLENLTKPIIEGYALATFTKEEYVANWENVWARCWNINSYLPDKLHIDPNIGREANTFRAIKKDTFMKTKGYKNLGYGEDVSVLNQLPGIMAKLASGAICYHFNPSSLGEVFESARWVGKGEIKGRLLSFLVHFLPNSVIRGIYLSIKYKIQEYFVFRLIFDIGFSIGLWERFFIGKYVK